MEPGQIVFMLISLFNEYRKAREAQQALDVRTGIPDDPTTPEREDLLTDEQLFALLKSDASNLGAQADAIIAKYRARL